MSEGTVTQLGIRVWFWTWPWIGCLEDTLVGQLKILHVGIWRNEGSLSTYGTLRKRKRKKKSHLWLITAGNHWMLFCTIHRTFCSFSLLVLLPALIEIHFQTYDTMWIRWQWHSSYRCCLCFPGCSWHFLVFLNPQGWTGLTLCSLFMFYTAEWLSNDIP